jgi:hypothetical protein
MRADDAAFPNDRAVEEHRVGADPYIVFDNDAAA